MDNLFKLVFGNLYLRELILYYRKKYEENECVIFKDINKLRLYKDREYISKLIYKGRQLLKVGYLPDNGIALKEIEFTKFELSNLKDGGSFIPYGVEILTFSNYGWKDGNKKKFELSNQLYSTPFETLPKTIHTINNAIIVRRQDDDSTTTPIIIPSNIKSISFINSPLISKNNNCVIKPILKISKSIESLEFKDNSYNYNNGFKFGKGDFPINSGGGGNIKKLNIKGYCNRELDDDILPNSITDLTISHNNKNGSLNFLKNLNEINT